MKTVYIAEDDQCFKTAEECQAYEAKIAQRVETPVWLIEECIRQATPYMVSAAERRELKARLPKHLGREE